MTQVELGEGAAQVAGEASLGSELSLDRKVRGVLYGHDAWEVDPKVLHILNTRRGAAHAVRSAEIAQMLELDGGEGGRRVVTKSIENLRLLHSIPIGGSRMKPYGYFLIETRSDLAIALQPLRGELYAMLRLLRALAGRHETAAMYGQLMLALDEVSSANG